MGRLREDALQRLARCTLGATAVEMVFVFPAFFLLIVGVMAVSTVLFAHVNMENAAREAVRRMAVAEASFTGGGVKCDEAAAEISGSAEQVACLALTEFGTNFVVTASDACPAIREVRVQITIDASEVALGDLVGFFDDRTLAADVVMRREDEC